MIQVEKKKSTKKDKVDKKIAGIKPRLSIDNAWG
jgi:hypothetical protein